MVSSNTNIVAFISSFYIILTAIVLAKEEESTNRMPGKEGGKAKPLKKPKGKEKSYEDEDLEFLKKKKAEEAALKKAREALLKGKKK